MIRTPIALLLSLTVSLLSPAAALAVDGDGETTFSIPLKASHGLSVKLEADDDEIELKVSKRGQVAVYFAQGEVSPAGIAVQFGSFGEFVVDYEPFRTLETREPGRRCEGEPKTTTEGFFRGTLRFRGENGYVEVDASRVKGTLVLVPRWTCDYRSARVSRGRGRKASDDEATLAVRRGPIGFAAIGSREVGERPFTYYFASSQEVREGIGISRFTFATSRVAGFQFDNGRGTAFVDPPAPFAGSAHYLRRPGARPDRWIGSLTAPLLGLGRVPVAGAGFRARLLPELPEFE